MNIKLSFHNMPHSAALENHIREKLRKVESLFKNRSDQSLFVEFFLNAHTQHTHHAAEMRIKNGTISATTHDEGPDMYVVADNVIEKMITIIKKEKAKISHKKHNVITDKRVFSS